MIRYYIYDNLNIDDELEMMKSSDYAEIILEPQNKRCLFYLGMLFANGIKIKILNKNELNFEETNKSFQMMSYVWDKLGDNHFPSTDYTNVITEMDYRIENIKRLGVKINKIDNNPIENKIFLICPVRNASIEQRMWIENFVKEKRQEGYIIHAPHLNTRQIDLFGGYAICVQNAEAVASSNEIDIYYDQKSTGSVFDLGVAYALNKPLRLLNHEEITFNPEDFIDNLIKNWPHNKKDIKQVLKNSV